MDNTETGNDQITNDDDDEVVVLGTKAPSIDTMTTSTTVSQRALLVEQHGKMTVRFSASDIAAMAGCHPFKNMAQLLHRLVYQGRTGALLLQLDAEALGLSLVAKEEEIWKSLAAQAGPKTTKALDKVLTGKTSKTVPEAQALKEQLVQTAKASGKLKPAELKVLAEGARHTVNTRFGTTHEDNALDYCERQFGWEILERNVAVMEWPFQKVPVTNNNSVFVATAEPLQDAEPCWRKAVENIIGEEEKVVGPESIPLVDSTGADREANFPDAANTAKVCTNQPTLPDASTLVTDYKSQLSTPPGQKVSMIDDYKTPSLSKRITDIVASPLALLGSWLGKSAAASRKRHHTEACDANIISSREAVSTDPLHSTTKEESVIQSILVETVENQKKKKRKYEKDPYFVIRGAVDGIREELHISPPPQEASPAGGDTINRANTNEDEFGDEDWSIQRIVVELKHRMNRIYHSPPLYEQIQAVVYCFMYKTTATDIVQVMRHEQRNPNHQVRKGSVKGINSKENENKDPNSSKETSENPQPTTTDRLPQENQAANTKVHVSQETASKNKSPSKPVNEKGASSPNKATPGDIQGWLGIESQSSKVEAKQIHPKILEPVEQQPQNTKVTKSTSPLTIQADRISLDDPTLQHRKNWHDVILPRLCSFADAVYTIRKDDGKRYKLLIACSDALGELEQDAWLLLHEECPWMRDCDTAFFRR